MSQVLEFKGIAIKHGSATLQEHMKNYFSVTGRLMDAVAWKSLASRLNKALKSGEVLHDLAGSVVLPNPYLGGTRPEWTLGLQVPTDSDASDDKPEFALSTDLTRFKAQIAQGESDFVLDSTKEAVNTTMARIATSSRIAQRELTGGPSALDYERRAQQMESAALQRELERVQAANSQQAKLIDALTNLIGREGDANNSGRQLVLGNGRSTRRPVKDNDLAAE